MYKVIQFKDEPEYIEGFINLPQKLYSQKEIMQNTKEELEVLKEQHILSKYFNIHRFLVIDDKKQAHARAIITIYPNDSTAYFGFFECVNNLDVSSLLLEEIEKYAKKLKLKKIIGPVDGSIWIKYRFKVNEFGNPYIGEPYNKEYYIGMFKESGYTVLEKYKSNQYISVEKKFDEKKYSTRLKDAKEAGYVFKSPSKENFYFILKQIYRLLIDLYRNFLGYKFITEDEFVELYQYFYQIADYKMIKVVYFKEELVGFFVSVPNYKNLPYKKKGLLDYIKLITIKMITKEYVMLYMGVAKEHRGLGKALAEEIKTELSKSGASSIGALIRSGNINENYFKNLIEREYEYVLLEKEIKV